MGSRRIKNGGSTKAKNPVGNFSIVGDAVLSTEIIKNNLPSAKVIDLSTSII